MDAGEKIRFRVIAVLAVFFAGAALSAEKPEYKPVKAPLWPGLRKKVDSDQAKRLKPYLTGAGGDILFASDLLSEVGRGGTNAAAALGNGRLSVEISPWAQLTVVRWPSPLYGHQLRYYTLPGTEDRPVRMGAEAPSADWRLYGHPQEPCESLGSRGGLVLDSGTVVWLGGPEVTTNRIFYPEDSMNLITWLYIHPELTTVVTDFVDPDRDLLVRHFRILGSAKKFFYHSTFAPVIAEPDEGKDWTSKDGGFATVYLASDQVVVAFKPKSKGLARPRKLKAAPESASALDAAYPGGGTFVAWGFMEPVSGFQVGADRCETKVPADDPPGGFDDASDGALSGNALYTGPGDAALSVDLAGLESVNVVMAIADSAQKAVALVNQSRAQGYNSMKQRSIEQWQDLGKDIHLPSQADTVTQRVIRRSVLNVLAGQDKDSGAIVASVSAQPPYHYDYPRDSAFFDLLLDMAGFTRQVTRHHLYFARTQYTKRLAFSPVWMVNFRPPFFDPSGNWPQKMSTDGSSPTSFWANPCEIDETALTVWNFWRHEKVLPEPEKQPYRDAISPAFLRAADNLLQWIDLKKDWTKPAIEDDSFPPDATLHGASSALTAMAAACDAGPRWGFPETKTQNYCEAARSLRAGIRARTVYPEVIAKAGFRGKAWTLWPAPAWDDFTEPGAKALKEVLAESIRSKASKEAPGFAYLGEEITSLALADPGGEYRRLLEDALKLLTHEVPFHGTDCYGEITMWGDFAGDGSRVAQQRTAIPHLWNGTTVYLAALAIYEPELFKEMTPPVP